MCRGTSEKPFSSDILDTLAQETRLPRDTVAKLHSLFYTDYPAGQVTKEGFVSAVCVGDPTDPLHGQRQALAANVFAVFNTSNDGVMTFPQYVRALGVLQNGSFAEKLAKAFDIYDVHHRQFLTQEEVALVWRCSDDEHHQGLGEDVILQRIQLLDSDCDGKLSRSDFYDAHKIDPQILPAVMETAVVDTMVYRVTTAHSGNGYAGVSSPNSSTSDRYKR